MKLEDQFDVAAAPQEVWDFLNDVPRVVPCMPGAELTDVVGDDRWKGRMAVKMGPISLQFGMDVTREEADADSRSVRLKVVARELRGRGAARATVRSSIEDDGAGARVTIETDVTMQGAVAQFGGGIVSDVAHQMTQQFASCVAGEIAGGRQEPAAVEGAPAPSSRPAPTARPAPKPVSGLRLGLRAVWNAIIRALRRARS